MKIVSVISKINLDVTFAGVPCLLRRTKKEISEQNGITTMRVVTDRVTFEDVEVPIYTDVEVLDEEGNPTGAFEQQLNEYGELMFETKTQLVSHSVRDANGIGRLTENEVNQIAEMTSQLITEECTEMERRQIQEVQGLLYDTVSKEIYGTDQWEIYTGE